MTSCDVTGADNSADVHDGAPGVCGHDDVSAVLGVDVEPEAGGLVVVQEEGGAVLTGATSETEKCIVPCFHKKAENLRHFFVDSMIVNETVNDSTLHQILHLGGAGYSLASEG